MLEGRGTTCDEGRLDPDPALVFRALVLGEVLEGLSRWRELVPAATRESCIHYIRQ